MAAVFDDELNSSLDQLILSRPISHRRRSSDPWFDAECRAAKRLTRRLERAYAAARRRHTTTTTSISSDGNSAIHDPVTPIVADRHDNDAAAAAVAAARRAWYDQHRAHRQLRHQKCSAFWAQKVESEKAQPAKLWRSVDQLLDRGRVPVTSSIDVETRDHQQVLCGQSRQGARFYRQRAATDVHSCPCRILIVYEFCTLSVDDVISSVRRLPDKSSAADPIPTFVLKQIIDLLAPFITELFNCSLATGHFPGRFKDAFITPIVKKAGLDPTDASSYRPISNLPVLSKLLKRLVVHQLMNYLTLNNLLPSLQSGFRPGHSTETAILLNCAV